MKHTISILVENEFGVLARVAGLFSSKGYNIDSLTVSPTLDPTVSRMTIVTRGSDHIVEQITKQLNRLVNTIKVQDLTQLNFIHRELLLVKLHVSEKNRAEVLKLNEAFHGRVVDAAARSLILEFTGENGSLEGIIEMLKPIGIVELVRTGNIAIQRGSQGIEAREEKK